MKVIEADNVNSAYVLGLQYLREVGHEQESRAGKVLVCPRPVTTVYTRPAERVLFEPLRDANPFFHIMEALWMLSGSNDATWLDRFVGNFSSRFAEENGLMHGAYGYRWRWHFDVEGGGVPILPDQLNMIVDLLRKNPEDRRIVLTMWDPVADLGQNKKDHPCLSGDTIVWSPEGDCSISELANRFADGKILRWPVYSVDTKTWKLRLTWATKVWKSGRKKVIKLRFDDGSELRLTPDHRLYRRPGGLRSRIRRSEEVMASELRVGDRVVATSRIFDNGYEKIKRYLGGTDYNNIVVTHREYWELVNGGTPAGKVVHHINEKKLDNRIVNLACWDKSYHDSYHRMGERNPMKNLSPGQHRVRAIKQGLSLAANWAGLSKEDKTNRLMPMWSNPRTYGPCSKEQKLLLSKALKGKPKSEEHKQAMRDGWKRRREALGTDNHVIVSIEEGGFEDVYDFEVPGEHTALVGTGVLVHNCNTHAYFRVRPIRFIGNCLDMTVCCRSNDAIFGCYGANAVHFSVLQEYLAVRIGVKIGTYYQMSNNFHAYLDVLDKVGYPSDHNYYWQGIVQPTAIFTAPEHADEDIKQFTDWVYLIDKDELPVGYYTYHNPWFTYTAEPLVEAHWLWKSKRRVAALEVLDKASYMASDWKLAAQQWMERRMIRKDSE